MREPTCSGISNIWEVGEKKSTVGSISRNLISKGKKD